ncbi:MAG: PAS domain-containing protein [Filomicrobium sp.]
MRTKTNAKLYAYWNSVRGDRKAPQRFEIEPSRIAEILSETFILEFRPTNSYIYRLAGTKLGEYLGHDLRGSAFISDWQENDRFTLRRHFASIRKLGAVVRILLQGTTRHGTTRHFELLILPVTQNSPSIERFLGAISPLDERTSVLNKPVGNLQIIETELTYPASGFDEKSDISAALPQPSPPERQDPPAPPILANFRNSRIVRQDRRQFRVYDGGIADTTPKDN